MLIITVSALVTSKVLNFESSIEMAIFLHSKEKKYHFTKKRVSVPEKDVVPDVHSHVRSVSRVDRHDVSIDHHHRASAGRCHEVAVNLNTK